MDYKTFIALCILFAGLEELLGQKNEDEERIHGNFKNLFEGISKNDRTRIKAYEDVLQNDRRSQDDNFNAMKEEIGLARLLRNGRGRIEKIEDRARTRRDPKSEDESDIDERERDNSHKDVNHPGHLIPVDKLQWSYGRVDDDVNPRIRDCDPYNPSLNPPDLDFTQREIFYYDYREWWAIFKHSQYGIIRELGLWLRKLNNITTPEEQAVVMAHLNVELRNIAKKRIVYEKSVVVKESDEESVIRALQVWGLNNEKLLGAARAVHRVWDGVYSREDVVWPQTDENNAKCSQR